MLTLYVLMKLQGAYRWTGTIKIHPPDMYIYEEDEGAKYVRTREECDALNGKPVYAKPRTTSATTGPTPKAAAE